ncbi:MAG: hypothetical protein DMG36_25935 [Acidobacteria bacterium]|nr:MAG: hypothetical protein DMG36_25935 [Acidobacteriota bacterium]
MRESNQIEARSYLINVLLSVALIVFGILWLIAFASGKVAVIGGMLRPYLPSWFPLANLLLAPITCALAGSRAVSFRIGFFFVLVFVGQLSLLGLSADRYPTTKALFIIFLYFETFVLLPRWNRRMRQSGEAGTVLGPKSE